MVKADNKETVKTEVSKEAVPENYLQTLKKWSKEKQKSSDLRFYGGVLLTAAGAVAAGAALFGALPIAVLPFGAAAAAVGTLAYAPQVPGRLVGGLSRGFGG